MSDEESVIWEIHRDEMPPSRRGNSGQLEYDRVRKLEVDTGIQFKCRWTHDGKKGEQCRGVTNVYSNARRHHLDLLSRCRDGYVYVWRRA